jgi:hypothetical protein
MPDDHSDLVPLLPIPNRTVKRVSADDSADPRVKVGHRQAITVEKTLPDPVGFFFVFAFQSQTLIQLVHPLAFAFIDDFQEVL